MSEPSKKRRAPLVGVQIDAVLLVGLSCAVTFFMGVLSSFYLLRESRPAAAADDGFRAMSDLPSLLGLSYEADSEDPVSQSSVRVRDIPTPEIASGDVFLVAITLPDPADLQSRIVVRQSWAKIWQNQTHLRGRAKKLLGSYIWLHDDMGCVEYFRHYFILSQFALLNPTVQLESKEEGDMIFTEMNMFGSKFLKLLWALNWLLEHVKYHYLVKTDSSTFLYVPAAIWWLREARDVPKSAYYAGKVAKKAGVIRQRRSPWFMSRFVYSEGTYPDYVRGVCIIMSRDVSRTLVVDWISILKGGDSAQRRLLHMDDVDVGISLYHSALVPRDIVHVYAAWESGLCRDQDFIAAGQVPRDVLLSANYSTGYHICGGRQL